ncbi:MAG: hypothetical protein JW751_20940 [Polyangiaceae bacterium]|nr:hypothetical protein [Polyangiaceae bacterium]
MSARNSVVPFVLLLAAGCRGGSHNPSAEGAAGATGAGELVAGAAGEDDTGSAPTVAPRFPFGAHVQRYAEGMELPAGDPANLDAAAAAAYEAWKEAYLRAGCGSQRFYVTTDFEPGNLTLSEAHGYGMLLVALMAGHDPEARGIFDGMVRFLSDQRSDVSPSLMGWYVNEDCDTARDGERDAVTATDGDLDIAYALLLAETQWGNCGGIRYGSSGREMFDAIAAYDLDPTLAFPRPGSWATEGAWTDVMRASDFMPGHFAAFAADDPDGPWAALTDGLFTSLAALQAGHAPATGLVPDYVVDPSGNPAPATSGPFTATDGSYSWNSCRVPFRVGVHGVVSGDPRALALIGPIDAWFAEMTDGDPALIASGYALDGTPLDGAQAPSLAFMAPLGVSALLSDSDPAWRDALFATLVDAPPDGYFADTLRVLALVVMSGNWIVPTGAVPCP